MGGNTRLLHNIVRGKRRWAGIKGWKKWCQQDLLPFSCIFDFCCCCYACWAGLYITFNLLHLPLSIVCFRVFPLILFVSVYHTFYTPYAIFVTCFHHCFSSARLLQPFLILVPITFLSKICVLLPAFELLYLFFSLFPLRDITSIDQLLPT